jgi:hypothetical protein
MSKEVRDAEGVCEDTSTVGMMAGPRAGTRPLTCEPLCKKSRRSVGKNAQGSSYSLAFTREPGLGEVVLQVLYAPKRHHAVSFCGALAEGHTLLAGVVRVD